MQDLSIDFRSGDGQISANGVPFSIKVRAHATETEAAADPTGCCAQGVNWFGAEGENGTVEGLTHGSLDRFFEFLSTHNFNAVRILFNHRSVRENRPIPARSFSALHNPSLYDAMSGKPVEYLRMLVLLVEAAARRNVLVLIACGRLAADYWPGSGLWYDDSIGISEESVLASWSEVLGATSQMLAATSPALSAATLRAAAAGIDSLTGTSTCSADGPLPDAPQVASTLCGQWNVFAADLMNKPHEATWAMGNPRTDWDAAAARIGNHLLSQCPRWMIFVSSTVRDSRGVEIATHLGGRPPGEGDPRMSRDPTYIQPSSSNLRWKASLSVRPTTAGCPVATFGGRTSAARCSTRWCCATRASWSIRPTHTAPRCASSITLTAQRASLPTCPTSGISTF